MHCPGDAACAAVQTQGGMHGTVHGKAVPCPSLPPTLASLSSSSATRISRVFCPEPPVPPLPPVPPVPPVPFCSAMILLSFLEGIGPKLHLSASCFEQTEALATEFA